jgi:ubiquitin thioesterase OTU1
MFTAVGGALRGLVPPGGASSGASEYTPSTLRRIVVDAIRDNPTKFDVNFLGASPSRYCERMLGGMWGGGIELSILSELFCLEIYSIDVKTGKAYQFGEQQGYEEFCVVIYSGVHVSPAELDK